MKPQLITKNLTTSTKSRIWRIKTLLVVILEKAMAPHSSTLAWKIPWMEEPGGLQSMGSLRVRHDWVTSLSLFTFMHWRRKVKSESEVTFHFPSPMHESEKWKWSHFHFSLSCIGEGNGNPLQCSCLENPRDGGAWWAAVHGVAQSRTRLKRLSSGGSSLIFGRLHK